MVNQWLASLVSQWLAKNPSVLIGARSLDGHNRCTKDTDFVVQLNRTTGADWCGFGADEEFRRV